MAKNPIDDLENLLSPERAVSLKLQGFLADFDGGAVLVSASTQKYAAVSQELLAALARTRGNGVYLGVNKSAAQIHAALTSKSVPLEKVLFIDAIAKSTKKPGAAQNGMDAVFVDAPSDLSGMADAVSIRLEGFSGKKGFFVLDSVSTLLLYNSPDAVERFVHALVSRCRDANVDAFFLVTKSARAKPVIATVSQFASRVLEID